MEEFTGINTFEPSRKTCRVKEATVGIGNQLLAFEERCWPGGSDSVILYNTSLRGIRKTFEYCHSRRFNLDGFQVKYYTRDAHRVQGGVAGDPGRCKDGRCSSKVVHKGEEHKGSRRGLELTRTHAAS